MKRQLIISQEQFKKLNEVFTNETTGSSSANDIVPINNVEGNITQDDIDTAAEDAKKLGVYRFQVNNLDNPTGITAAGGENPNMIPPSVKSYNGTLAESISLSKSQVEDARKKSRMMESGDKVYSKASFTKKLNEDYKEFNNRLMQKRKNYGK